MDLLDLRSLAEGGLQRDPYEWGYVKHAIARQNAATLLATFPTRGFWQLKAHDGEKYYDYAARPLVTLGADRPALPETLHPAWLQVADELCSPAYRQALGQFIGHSLDDAQMEASVWRWDADAQLGPHLDLATKVVTQVFYLTIGWDPVWGGCLRILRSKSNGDMHAELPPALGSASVLVRSDHSWHSVTPVRAVAPAPRRSLIVTWLHADATSPVWEVSSDGTVSCPKAVAELSVA